MNWAEHLNEQQLPVVTHGEGPLQVRAGPGSGKTRTLTYRIAYLVGEGFAAPRQVLALTFTRKAGEEMRSRVDELLPDRSVEAVTATHFHSFGYKLIAGQRHSTDHPLLARWDGSSVAAKGFYNTLWRKACAEAGVAESLHYLTAASTVSSARNDGLELEAFREKVDERSFPDPLLSMAADAWEAYEELKAVAGKKGAGAIDYDDMIVLLERELRTDRAFRAKVLNRFRWVLVDECQDLNIVQWRAVQLIAPPPAPNLMVVGDLDQGIYAFRGARPAMMREFEEVYPNASVFRLEQNYRSTRKIVDLALRLIEHNRDRQPKSLWAEQRPVEKPPELAVVDDGGYEAAAVGALVGDKLGPWQKGELGRVLEPSDVAILVRCWWLTRGIEDELLHRRIPYLILGGTGFYGRREVKDILAYLEAGCALAGGVGFDLEEAGLRIYNTPNRYLGRAAKGAVERTIAKGAGFVDALLGAAYSKAYMRERAGELKNFLDRCAYLCTQASNDPAGVVNAVIQETGYLRWLDETFDDPEDRRDNVLELAEAAAGHTSVENLVRYAKLAAVPKVQAEQTAVQLMTIHRAKGKEWQVVVLMGASEGVLPHAREDNKDEERRLAYVAATRAERELYITSALSYRRRPAQPSRFLFEAGLLASCRACGGEGYEGGYGGGGASCEACGARGWVKSSRVPAAPI